MHEIGRRGSTIAAAIALLVAGSASAAESQDKRIAEVVAARIELQRSLGEWLAGSLAKPAQPFRVDPVVQVILKGDIRELQQQEESIGGDVKFGGKTNMKLPGLGFADAGGNNTPEVTLRGPGTRTTRTIRQLDMSVVRLVVRLYVDPEMPKDRRELIRNLATDLVGIEPARGDELVVADLPGANAAPTVPVVATPNGQTPAAMMPIQAGAGDRPRSAGEIIAFCLTALAAAGILAYGISRKAQQTVLERGGEGEHGGVEIADGRVVDIHSGEPLGGAGGEGRKDGAFAALADASPRELVETMSEIEPVVAAAILEQYGLSDDASRLFYAIIPPNRQAEIGLWLGKSRVIPRTELAQMEAHAAAGLAKVRSRVTVGGTNRLAAFLSAAPDDARQRLLEDVASRDPALADAARGAMVVFDDLVRFSDKSVRRVVTGVDPAVVALALAGAGAPVRDAVLNAVSKRLRAMIEGEADAVKDRPSRDVEAARRVVERSMLQLHTRGELVSRAA